MEPLIASRRGWWLTIICGSIILGSWIGWQPTILLVIGGGAIVVRSVTPISWKTLGVGILTVAASFGLAATRSQIQASIHLPAGGIKGPISFTGVVRSGTLPGQTVNSIVVDVDHVNGTASTDLIHRAILVTLFGNQNTPLTWQAGEKLRIQASSIRPLKTTANNSYLDHLEQENVVGTANSTSIVPVSPAPWTWQTPFEILRNHVVIATDQLLSHDLATLLLAIAFGIHRTLPTYVRLAYQNTGLIHIVALSGLKVAIVSKLINSLSQIFAWSPRKRLVIVAAVLAMYVSFAGAPAAAVRSAVMAIVALWAANHGRKVDVIPLLISTAAIMVLISPTLIHDVGFQLTFLGTLGIILYADSLQKFIPLPHLLAEPFAVTLAAQLLTWPVTASTFGTVSLIAPVTNALVLPFIPPLIVFGGIGALAATVAPVLGIVPLQACGTGVWILTKFTQAVATIPGIAVSWPS